MRIDGLFEHLGPGREPPPATSQTFEYWDQNASRQDERRFKEVSFGLRPLDKPGRLAVYRRGTTEKVGSFLRNRNVRPKLVERLVNRTRAVFTFLDADSDPLFVIRRTSLLFGAYEIKQFNNDLVLVQVSRSTVLYFYKAWNIELTGGIRLRLERVKGSPLIRIYRDHHIVAATTILQVTRPKRFGLEVYRCTEEEALLVLGVFYIIERSLKSIPKALKSTDLTVDRLTRLGRSVVDELGYSEPALRPANEAVEGSLFQALRRRPTYNKFNKLDEQPVHGESLSRD